MSVLITGMEMPIGDEAITLFLYPDGKVVVCGMLGPLDHYKAVPVPPHGRLIDADALNYTMLYKENWMSGTGVESPAVWRKDIEDAPTIIPADHIGDVNEMVTDKEGEG